MNRMTLQILLSAALLMVALDVIAVPRIELFPTSVAENIRHASERASQMENDMESVMTKMDRQLALYHSAKCDNSSTDQGCQHIKKQISDTYLEFLTALKQTLPEVKSALQSTADELGSKIHQQLGNRMTPRGIQNLLNGKEHTAATIREATGHRQGRMSKLFNKVYRMIATNSNNAPTSAILAAEVYADSSEALDVISAIEADITASEVPLRLEGLWNGGPNQQMLNVVSATKTLLFGDAEEEALPKLVNAPTEVKDDYSDWTIE